MRGAAARLLCLLGSAGALTELTEGSFDKVLRESPVALVAFVATWCGAHCRALLPELERLAAAYEGTGVAVARVSSDGAGELLDRYDVAAYPTLLWLDGSKQWPFYASEATPERVSAVTRTFAALADFVRERTGIAPQTAEPRPQEAPPSAEPPPPAPVPTFDFDEAHVCTELSRAYTKCLRVRKSAPHKCASERHEYMICMSGRWSIDPDHHRHMAARYSDFVRDDDRS
jgi:thiol-disulfide isomerase/thioredoxin